MKNAYIIDGIRTPIGNYQGTLSTVRTDDLAALVIADVMKRNANIPKEAIDDVWHYSKESCTEPKKNGQNKL